MKRLIAFGAIKRGQTRSSACNVVDPRLEDAWYDYENGDDSFQTYATVKAIPHYRRY